MVRPPRHFGAVRFFVSGNDLDRYCVIAKLGRGGMSDVYLAATKGPAGFSKLLVVKVLQEELARTGEFLGMFRDEARLAARLNHPNVVQTYEVGESEGRHFISMEYLEGQPLHRVIERFGQQNLLDLGIVLRIGIDALAGLHYAHELRSFDGKPLGVVHRDVTPQNIFITYDGQVKLVDFGIAKAFDSTTHTKVGTVKGKVSYMAPEQARGESVDRTADLFSMAVLLWEMLASSRLWEGLTDIAVVGKLVQGDIPHLESVRPDLPPSLAALVMSALNPIPGQRPPSAAAFQKGLEEEMERLAAHVTNHRLGELMCEVFEEERAKVRNVVGKQLERMSRDSPTPITPPRGFQFDGPGAGDMPVLGEGSSIHDAPTTIHTTLTGELLAAHAGEVMTTSAPAVLAHDPKSEARRGFTWGAVALVGVAGVGIGVLQPWSPSFSGDGSQPSTHAAALSGAAAVRGALKTGPQGDDMNASSAPGVSASCRSTNKPTVELSGEIAKDATLTCDKDYLLRFTTYVTRGATLVIEPGTRIRGDFETKGTLVVQPGARIEARGTPELPIVFTAASDHGRPGAWGGVILLGEAPINLKDSSGRSMHGRIEGVTTGGEYGGDNPNDSSGVLSYVRIEYAGIELAPNNEINGLTFGGVGRGTVVDHVQVRHPADDCFEFFGGTVDAKYLVCQHPDDDAFDWDFGYRGRLPFLVAQSDPSVTNGSHGFEGDNDPAGSANFPVSEPSIYNVTLCGKNRRLESQEHYGLLLRKGSHVRLRNSLFMGFAAALDVRDAETKPNVSASIFFQNLVYNLAYPESGRVASGNKLLIDDDAGFDEIGYLRNPGLRIFEEDPQLGNCFDPRAPGFKPKTPLVAQAAIPPNDGFFDSDARFVGAFRDRDDDWDAGNWLVWSE